MSYLRSRWLGICCLLGAVMATATLARPVLAGPPQVTNILPRPIMANDAGRVAETSGSAAQIYYSQSVAQLAHEEALNRQVGMPLSVRDLKQPLPPASQNAAIDYIVLGGFPQVRRASALVTQYLLVSHGRVPPAPQMGLLGKYPLTYDEQELLNRIGDIAPVIYTANEQVQMRKLLSNRKDVMDLIHRATDKPLYVYPRDWSLGHQIPIPNLMAMRQMADLLALESYFLALDGHYKMAIANQIRGLRLANHLGQDPVLISELISIACRSIAIRGMKDILYLAGPNAEAAASVQEAITANQLPYDLAHVIATESILSLVFLDGTRGRNPYQTLGYFWRMYLAGTGAVVTEAPANAVRSPAAEAWINVAEAGFLHFTRPFLMDARKPFPGRLAALQIDSNELQRQIYGTNYSLDSLYPPRLFLSHALIWWYSVSLSEAESVAMAGNVEAGAAALAYKGRHGKFPDRLEEAMTKVPMDPFNGKTLSYQREENGFVVYSVGEDGKYDGKMSDTEDFARYSFRYSAVTGLPAHVDFTLDTSDAPELREFAERAIKACTEWYPKISLLLPSPGYTPPTHLRLVFSNNYKGVVVTDGDTITCSVDYFKNHQDDIGALIYMMVNVIQHYRNGNTPGWLVAGIADYIRWHLYEPKPKPGNLNPNTVNYENASADFLAFVTQKYGKDIVTPLNAAMREGRYRDSLFRDLTGWNLDQLNHDWQASLRATPAEPAAHPRSDSAERAANEASAIGCLRTLNSAEATYRSRQGAYGSLDDLRHTNLIDPSLASGEKSGYRFNIGMIGTTYRIAGDPLKLGQTGIRYFYTDETGVIYYGKAAAPNSHASGAPAGFRQVGL